MRLNIIREVFSLKKIFSVASVSFTAFVVWTLLVLLVDVAAIGPRGSVVGISSVNNFFHTLTGVHMELYVITDWLSLIPIAVVFGFAILGLFQWIKRKNMLKVDADILALGVFYILLFACYFLFELVVINYRPTLINGYLEASYPSSTTLLVLCVMPTAMAQFKWRIQNAILRRCTVTLTTIFTVLMVVGRLLSGVHWLSDIIGGVLLSMGLDALYIAACKLLNGSRNVKI